MDDKISNNQTGIQIIEHLDIRWIDFIESHSQANIFHHPAWINLLSICYGYHPFILVEIDANGKICAGIPFAQVNSILTGKRWVSLPFTDYCIPLYKDEKSLASLTNWLYNAYTENKIPRIELRWKLPDHEMVQPNSEFVIHTIQLYKDPDIVAQNFKRTHRQNIHTAEKRGVRIQRGDQIDHLRLYYQLQIETRIRHGLPVQPWRFFEYLESLIFSQGLGFVLLAYKESECIAGVVFLCWQNYLVAKYAASKADTLKLRPNNLLFWNGITWGCENGISIFDFGRTEISNNGLRRYKRGWGASEQNIAYSVISQKEKKTSGGKIQKLIQPVFRNSPPWVCKLAGELLYKHYG